MDTNDLLNAISSVGFPIAAFLLMFWRSEKTEKTMTETIEKLKDAINTLIIKIEKEDKK